MTSTTYPKAVPSGPGMGDHLVWACCESTIGPACSHLEWARRGIEQMPAAWDGIPFDQVMRSIRALSAS